MAKRDTVQTIDLDTTSSGTTTIYLGGGGSGGGSLVQHALFGSHHTGTLDQTQAPWALHTYIFENHESNANAHHYMASAGVNGGVTVSFQQEISVDSTVVRTSRQIIAGAGLIQVAGPSLTANVELAVGGGWTIATTPDGVDVRLAPISGLQATPDGLLLDDNIAGVGLGITNKVLRVNAGDGIEIVSDLVKVRAADIVGVGLIHDGSNNLAIGTPGNVAVGVAASVTTGAHSHTVISTDDGNLNRLRLLHSSSAGGVTLASLTTNLVRSNSGDIVLTPFGNTTTSKIFSSTGAQTGISGYTLTASDGSGDFQKLFAKELTVQKFISDINLALAGSDFVVKSVATLSRDFTTPTIGGGGFLYVYDLPGTPDTQTFEEGDWVRLRYVERGTGLVVGDCWGHVVGYLDLPEGEQRWTFNRVSGAVGKTIGKGMIALDYGTSGDGYWHVTTLQAHAPYAQIVTWADDPSLGGNHTVHVRIGNLNGISNAAVTPNGWGIYTDNLFATGTLTAAQGQVRIDNDGGINVKAESVTSALVGPNYNVDAYGYELTFTSDPASPTQANTVGRVRSLRYANASDIENWIFVVSESGGTSGATESNIRIASNSNGNTQASITTTAHSGGTTEINILAQNNDFSPGSIRILGTSYFYSNLLPLNAGVPNIGSPSQYFNKLYVNEIIAGTTSTTDTGHNHDDRYYLRTETNALLAAKASTSHVHTQYATIDALTNGLASKAATTHTHADLYYLKATVDNMVNGLAAAVHTHNELYYTKTENDSLLAGKAAFTHNHNGIYYLKSEIDSMVSGISTSGHTHDDRYFTETEIAVLLGGKSDTGHTHSDYIAYTTFTYELGLKSDVGHGHDDRYYTEAEIDTKFLTFVPGTSAHTHATIYYTKTETDGFLAAKSSTGHTHGDIFYTKTEVNNLLLTKASTTFSLTGGQGMTGAGTLADSSIQFNVGQGFGIAVGENDVAVDTAAIIDTAYGLVLSSGVIRINKATNSGLSFTGGLGLGTPETITGASTNSVTGSTHTHAVTSSDTPGNDEIISTSASGAVTLSGGNTVISASALVTTVSIKANAVGVAALTVQAIASQTGRLISAKDASGVEMVALTAAGAWQSANFTSGTTGYQLAANGNAELNNMTARGELRSFLFVKNETRVESGSQLWAPAGMTISAFTVASGTLSLDIKDPPYEHATVFGVGDILQMKSGGVLNYATSSDPSVIPSVDFFFPQVPTSSATLNIAETWLEVTAVTDMTTFYRYSVIKRSGSSVTFPINTVVVSYGTGGKGRLKVQAEGTYAPYLEVFTASATPWAINGITPHVRLGRVDGLGALSELTTEQYGIVIATDATDPLTPRIVATNLQFTITNIDIDAHSVSGATTAHIGKDGITKFGGDISQEATTMFSFIPEFQSLVLGNSAHGSMTMEFDGLASGTQGVVYFNGLDVTFEGSSHVHVRGVLDVEETGMIYAGTGTYTTTGVLGDIIPATGIKLEGTGKLTAYVNGGASWELPAIGPLSFGNNEVSLGSSGLAMRGVGASDPPADRNQVLWRNNAAQNIAAIYATTENGSFIGPRELYMGAFGNSADGVYAEAIVTLEAKTGATGHKMQLSHSVSGHVLDFYKNGVGISHLTTQGLQFVPQLGTDPVAATAGGYIYFVGNTLKVIRPNGNVATVV